MLNYLFRNADFSGLLKFVSPSFFKIIPPSMIIEVASELKRNHANSASWEAVRLNYQTELKKMGMTLDLQDAVPRRQLGQSDRALGELVLEVYFHQILTQDTWMIDFRSEAFPENSHQKPKVPTVWAPKAIYSRIEPGFLQAIRSMYIGFYEENDSMFNAALRDLGLVAAGQSLRDHFGVGDQSQVRFQLRHFQKTFAAVFEVCAREKVRLHRDFAILGLMMLGLYELLEGIATPFDVRQCFRKARESALAS
jgi:hypothetical protein